MKQTKYTIQQFNRQFADNAACLDYLFKARFGTPTCPKCGRVGRYYRQEDNSHYVCACGGHQLSPKKGTIFAKSDTDLVKWFFAMFLIGSSKNSVSALEIQRQIGTCYRTAWRISQKIRSRMKDGGGLLNGIVEADETYIGGIRPGTRGRGAKGKTPVFGTVQRGGDVKAVTVPNVQAVTLMPLILKNVEHGTELMTDELRSYNSSNKLGFKHATVRHAAKEYARGEVHTNTIEGFWSQLKRSIDGTHHSVSPKHLQAYVDYHVWTWNRRNVEQPAFLGLLEQVARTH